MIEAAREVAEQWLNRPEVLGFRSDAPDTLATLLVEWHARGEAAGLERAARIAVRKSCMWSAEEDARSQDYREGVEDAASKIAAAVRALRVADEKKPS